MRHLFFCLVLFLVGNQFLSAQNSMSIEKHYITLISDYEQIQGKITKLQKNKENLVITVQSNNVKKDVVFHNTSENLVLFESAKVGYMFVCKNSEEVRKVALFYQTKDGGVRVYPFYLKEEK